MRSDRSSGSRRRLLASGLAAGALAGAALGASLLGHTAPTDVDVGPPVVLHAAPAVVTAGADVTLAATAVCDDPLQPACDLQRAAALVRPWGADGWTRVDGKVRAGTISFDVPGQLVPPEGFSYWLDVVSDAGVEVAYPPAGPSGAIRVVTSAGLPERSLRAFDWNDRAEPVGTVLRLTRGEGEGQVGFSGAGTEDGIRGPSSFDLTADGEIVVADPINRRVQWFGRDGAFRRAEPIPTTADVDLAVQPDGALAVATLGTSSTAYEVRADGSLAGSYPIGFGVVSRIAAGGVPRVRVGEAQWVPIRGATGVALAPDAQGRAQTSSVPLADGRVGYAGELQDGRLAVAWTRPDGSRGGTVLRLPAGVRAGADYFVHPLADGGALVARGLWDDSHFGVALMRLDATGRLRTFRLLPEPSRIMAAPYSTVRSVSARSVVMAEDDHGAILLRRYAV